MDWLQHPQLVTVGAESETAALMLQEACVDPKSCSGDHWAGKSGSWLAFLCGGLPVGPMTGT